MAKEVLTGLAKKVMWGPPSALEARIASMILGVDAGRTAHHERLMQEYLRPLAGRVLLTGSFSMLRGKDDSREAADRMADVLHDNGVIGGQSEGQDVILIRPIVPATADQYPVRMAEESSQIRDALTRRYEVDTILHPEPLRVHGIGYEGGRLGFHEALLDARSEGELQVGDIDFIADERRITQLHPVITYHALQSTGSHIPYGELNDGNVIRLHSVGDMIRDNVWEPLRPGMARYPLPNQPQDETYPSPVDQGHRDLVAYDVERR